MVRESQPPSVIGEVSHIGESAFARLLDSASEARSRGIVRRQWIACCWAVVEVSSPPSCRVESPPLTGSGGAVLESFVTLADPDHVTR